MPETDAVALENWFPRTTCVELRGGNSSFATGMTGNGKTLAVFNALDGTSKMFCSTASGIYDVSAAGAVGASVLARTNGKHQWFNFGDGTNNYLMMFNGVDKPAFYNGAAWVAVDGGTVPAITVVTTTNLIGGCSIKGQIFLIEKNKLKFWYLPAGAAGGAAASFPLDAIAKLGGYLMAIGSWTVDGGNGPDDRAVFVTSEGEVIIFAGTNPSSATTWALIGSYYLGKPLGRRCLCNYGSDLIVLTQNGAFPLSLAIQSSTIDYKQALSNKIEKAFTEAANSYGTTFGWCVTPLAQQSALIVNVPFAEDGVHQQYVMNTITRSWCNFSGWNAEDFAVYSKDLYFCSGTAVYKAWTGTSDLGGNINTYGKTAFSSFRRPGMLKQLKAFRPIISANALFTFLCGVDLDFEDTILTGSTTFTPVVPGKWGTGVWGNDVWGGNNSQIVKQWISPASRPASWISAKIRTQTNSLTLQWISNEFLVEPGGTMG